MLKRQILICLFFTSAVTHAQVREVLDAIKPKKKFEGTPVLQRKSQLLSIVAGTPNRVGKFLDFGVFGSYLSTAKNGTGPFYLRYECLIKDNIGLGGSMSYAMAEETYKNPFGSGTVTGKISDFSILLSSYYHFYTTDNLDTYSKGSVGLNLWSGSYKDQNDGEVKKFKAPTPVAYNALLGLRYFLSPRFCISGELGFGNLKFSAGLGAGIKLK